MFLGSRSPAIFSQRCGRLYGVLSQTVTVVGIGADGWTGLPPRSKAAIEQADALVGGPRQLSLLPDAIAAKRIPLPSPLLPGLAELVAAHAGSALVVLASGDPMFYGIGSTLVGILGAARVSVLPHLSSVSLAAARLGWPLDDVDVVSLVGRPRELLHPVLQPGRRVFALTAETTAAAGIRALLDGRGFGASQVTVLADLGGEQEAVGPADGRPHSRLAIIAIDCRLDGGAAPLPRVPGLPDAVVREAYSHEVSSAGFWPGNDAFPQAAFYSYAYPEPQGYRSRSVTAGACFDQALGEFILPYDRVRKAANPEELLLDFLAMTYQAAADAGHWDRASLECPLGIPGRVRSLAAV